jgi:hypothetical protein
MDASITGNPTWTRDVTRTGPQGNTVTRQGETTLMDTGSYRSVTLTLPNGNTAAREVTRTWDPETETLTRDSTVTGPQGNTVTRHSETMLTDTGFLKTTTLSGPLGSTRSTTREVSFAPDSCNQTTDDDVPVPEPEAGQQKSTDVYA